MMSCARPFPARPVTSVPENGRAGLGLSHARLVYPYGLNGLSDDLGTRLSISRFRALIQPHILRMKLEQSRVEERESNWTVMGLDSAANLSDNIPQQQHRTPFPNVDGERHSEVVIPTEHENSQLPSLRIFVIIASIFTVVYAGVTLLVPVLCHIYRHVCRRLALSVEEEGTGLYMQNSTTFVPGLASGS
jgi:hypothetical protein